MYSITHQSILFQGVHHNNNNNTEAKKRTQDFWLKQNPEKLPTFSFSTTLLPTNRSTPSVLSQLPPVQWWIVANFPGTACFGKAWTLWGCKMKMEHFNNTDEVIICDLILLSLVKHFQLLSFFDEGHSIIISDAWVEEYFVIAKETLMSTSSMSVFNMILAFGGFSYRSTFSFISFDTYSYSSYHH